MFTASLPLLFAITLTGDMSSPEPDWNGTTLSEEIRHEKKIDLPHNGTQTPLHQGELFVGSQPVVRPLIYIPPRNPFPVVLF